MRIERENPWQTLRSRPHLRLRWARLPEGIDGALVGDVITLDSRLDRCGRNAALMHELVHDERGITFPAASWALMEHEEEQVRREVVRRLIPTDALSTFLEARGTVLVHDIAEHFDVPDRIASDAARLLRIRRAA